MSSKTQTIKKEINPKEELSTPIVYCHCDDNKKVDFGVKKELVKRNYGPIEDEVNESMVNALNILREGYFHSDYITSYTPEEYKLNIKNADDLKLSIAFKIQTLIKHELKGRLTFGSMDEEIKFEIGPSSIVRIDASLLKLMSDKHRERKDVCLTEVTVWATKIEKTPKKKINKNVSVEKESAFSEKKTTIIIGVLLPEVSSRTIGTKFVYGESPSDQIDRLEDIGYIIKRTAGEEKSYYYLCSNVSFFALVERKTPENQFNPRYFDYIEPMNSIYENEFETWSKDRYAQKLSNESNTEVGITRHEQRHSMLFLYDSKRYGQINIDMRNLSHSDKCFLEFVGDVAEGVIEKIGYDVIFRAETDLKVPNPLQEAIDEQQEQQKDIVFSINDKNGNKRAIKINPVSLCGHKLNPDLFKDTLTNPNKERL